MTKIALVTGANKGIGFETARLLADQGHTVLVGARDEGRGRAAAERINARFLQLDVTDAASISAAAKEIDDTWGVLDILVNNAAIGVWDGPASQSTLDALRTTFETNLFGIVALTNALLPLLRRSSAGRIVNVSSDVGSIALMTDPANPLYMLNGVAYPASKSALNMATMQYAKELKDTPIKVNAVSPGYCATDLNNNSGYRTPEQGAQIAVQMANLGPDGPTGAFVDDTGTLPW
ncbi:SDR family oxidoreductase [Rhizocola hellebori]|uniref:SDR family oxidoreductase n=1 Tax=Rhizocola hellebori TaxID=1392758 RepID=UPI001942D0F4|nr:SDR family oxidoreductase [Rhizocola hellebori]